MAIFLPKQNCFQLVRINPSGGVKNWWLTVALHPQCFQLVRINPSGGVDEEGHLESAEFRFQLVRINPSGGAYEEIIITYTIE